MGRAVVHFEVMGRDSEKLRSFYAGLFDSTIDADNPVMGSTQVQPGIEPEGR